MTSSASDQGFTSYGSTLFTTRQPFDPNTRLGDPTDESYYTQRPGVDFLRPWLAIQNDVAFQWPLGLEGFTLTTDPVLGKHTFIGDNKVVVDVIHSGAEQITLNGSFPGLTAPAMVQALREVVRRQSDAGKILFVPEIMSHAQRVQVDHFESSRDPSGRGRTMAYTIEFTITGQAGAINTPALVTPSSSLTASPKGTSSRMVASNSTYNTLRKIASWKLGSTDDWVQLYALNSAWFDSRNIGKPQAPDYRLPSGTIVNF